MMSWISRKVRDFCDSFTKGFKQAPGIASPSKLFKEQIGKNLALGIGEGFKDEMANVVQDIKSGISTDFDLDLNHTVHSDL